MTAQNFDRSTALSRTDSRTQTLETQRHLVGGWLQSDEALRYAQRLTRRHQLRRSGEEVVSEAWIRMQGTFTRRSNPYPDLSSPESAQRFGARVLDTMCRDMARVQWKRDTKQTALAFDDGYVPQTTIEGKLIIEQLVFAVGRRARHSITCSGCDDQLVATAALELLHLLLIEHDGSQSGSSILDRLLYEALDRVTHDKSVTDDARRQRKGRCGKCIVALIEASLQDMGVQP